MPQTPSLLLQHVVQFALDASSGDGDNAEGGGGMGGMGGMDDANSFGCRTVRFPVPLFGGGPNSTLGGSGGGSSYHVASTTAHAVLGALLFAMVGTWSAFVLDVVRIRGASRASGACQAAMGLYLLSWLFCFMAPGDLPALWAYSLSDLLQLQHLAIALLLLAGGMIDLLQSACLLPPLLQPSLSGSLTPQLRASNSSWSGWHVAWCANLSLTGLVFLLHPQHSYGAAIKHVLLGCSLVLGSSMMLQAKSVAWGGEIDAERSGISGSTIGGSTTTHSRSGNRIDWTLIAAGGCFAVAACILLAFRDKETPVHMGTSPRCQPSFAICIVGYIVAAGSIVGSATVAVRNAWKRRSRRAATACVSPSVDTASTPSDSILSRALSLLPDCCRRRLPASIEERQGMMQLQDQEAGFAPTLRLHSAQAEEEDLHAMEMDQVGVHAPSHLAPDHSPDASSVARNSQLHRAYRFPSPSSSTADRPDDDDDTFGCLSEEDRIRELQRERRRQAEYTGEEELDE